MLRKIIQVLALTFLLVLVSFGQDDGASVESQDSKIPIKVDEFGAVGECDLGARIQNFFIELNNNTSATGYIIIYQGKDILPAEYDSNRMERRIKDNIRFLRLDASRIVIVSGGFRDELATELHLVPDGAEAPVPTGTIPAPTIPKNKSFLYDNKTIYGGYYDYYDNYNFLDEFILASVQAKLDEENRLAEEAAKSEELNSEVPAETEVEAVEENSEIEKPTAEEIEEAKFSWMNKKFADVIKNQKGTKGVIIFYADNEYYDVGKLQSLIEEGKQKIVEAKKVPAEKIEIVYGGYREIVETEFWIVPKEGENPTPTPKERPIEEPEN